MASLADALRYQEESSAAFGNPNLLAQGRNKGRAPVPGVPLAERWERTVSMDPQKNTDAFDTFVDVVGGFVPGVGQALAARDVERARRDDDKFGMGLAALGLIPFGGVAKAAKAADKIEGAADPFSKFGKKSKREADLAKKTEKLAQSEKPSKVMGAAVSPTVYRDMAASAGDEAVMDLLRNGGHLRPTGSGYVGAPRTVTSPAALGAMRRSLDDQFATAVDIVGAADPQRLGTWYDRAKSGIAMSAEPHQVPRVLDQHAVYSAGVSPENELAFALKHLNSRAVGEPAMAYRGAPMRKLDESVAAGVSPKLGDKISEYRAKNDPSVPNAGLFGVNDFRAAQGFGYTDPAGNIWKAGVSKTMHPFMDAETALTVNRANARAVGGRTDWAGPHVQELPWVVGKAQDIYGRGKSGRFAGEGGIQKAVVDANNTARDYFYKHAGSATHEAVPGKSTGHVPSVLGLPFEQKKTYSDIGRWDESGKDAIYSAIGFRQLPSIPSVGAYRNSAGAVEHNPLTIARPLLDFGTRSPSVAPHTMGAVGAAERFRAAIDAQEAGAANLFNTGSGSKKAGVLLDSRVAGDSITGVQPTPSQLDEVLQVLDKHGLSKNYTASATNRGIGIIPLGDDANRAGAQRLFTKISPELTAAFPSSVMKATPSTQYVPGIGKFTKEGIVPTAPFSGEATSGVLGAFADLKPAVSQNISESEAVRRAIREKTARDADMPGAREDIQNMRKFFSESDWSRAVDLIRKGMPPAAAVAALGYSLSSMAEER